MAELKIDKIDGSVYGRFLTDNPPANPFSLPPFLEAYREVFSTEVEYLAVSRGEMPVAVCAFFVGKEFRQLRTRLMPIRPYDGIQLRSLEDSKIQKKEYDNLMVLQELAAYLKTSFAFYQVVLPPDSTDVRPFRWDGAHVLPNYTYVVDLAGFSEDGYTKSLKEVLRAAENSGLSFGTCGVDELVSFQQLSYERHGKKPPVPPETLRSLLKRLEASNFLRTRCVRSKTGEVAAVMASLVPCKGSYFYVSGTDAKVEKGASHLLYHEVLKEEKREGKSFVDFCGANTPSINLFKSAFGPELKVYFKIWKANTFPSKVVSLFKKF